MEETVAGAPRMPIERTTACDPPPKLAELRAEYPVSRMAFPDGHVGWLVTDYAVARKVLTDRRFSSRNEMRRPVVKLPVADENGLRPMLPGAFIAMDPPDHTRYRRLLGGQFSSRRLQLLEPRITEIVGQHLDEMERQGPPLDLVQAFSLPIPSLVICELLGVPYADREQFQHYSVQLVRLDATPQEAESARRSFMHYLTDLVRHKRSNPDDNLISRLIVAGDLTDEELAGVSFLLLFAGHETTANMLALGIFALLTHPEQLSALRADPSLMDSAVEELLRYLSVVQMGTVRGALEDVDLEGSWIRAGDSVCISLPAANRDPEKFADPDRLDLDRSATAHVAFGHGIHQCLGKELARIEIRLGYAALLRRFPNLQLAVAPEDVPMRTDMIIYGVHELPISW